MSLVKTDVENVCVLGCVFTCVYICDKTCYPISMYSSVRAIHHFSLLDVQYLTLNLLNILNRIIHRPFLEPSITILRDIKMRTCSWSV